MPITDITRFVALERNLASSGQPNEAQFLELAAVGFQLVINLALHDDPRYSLQDEPAAVAAAGMRYVHIPVQFSAPTLDDLQRFCAAMNEAGEAKVLVHCAHNKRVPVFIALYRIREQGWAKDAALLAMRAVWEPDAQWSAFIEQALAA
jgi:uncharacterized protein (TIGR01244 family)